MKVIVAGCSKTGTKSMSAALRELGYNVYDNMEHVMYHCDDWIKIFEEKGRIEDFKRMYKDVDAVVDAPVYMFWYEIHQAFPDAKIILTTRDEESWYKSLQKQMQVLDDFYATPYCIFGFKFVPILRKSIKYMQHFIFDLTGMPLAVGHLKIRHQINEMVAKRKFREHNAFVLKMAPKNKLLVYDIKDGWAPLCEFLDRDVPSKPFPHQNIGGVGVVESANAHEYADKVKKQAMLVIIVLVFLFSIFFYCMSNYSYSTQIITSVCGVTAFLLLA